MAEAVAGLLTSAFVNIAKDKLGSAIREQASLLCNFDGDLLGMEEDLESISAALEDAERRSLKDNLVRLCLKRLKYAAIDITDILEDYQDTCDQATTKIQGVLSCLPVTCKKIVVANRMKTVRENLSKINKDFESFKFVLTQGPSTTPIANCEQRETTSYYLPEEPIIARDGEKEDIINKLSAKTNMDEIVIVPIYGLGGMGKSTLAQLVYNDDQFSKKYDHRIWVYVSQHFSLLKIGSSIISQLTADGGQQTIDSQQVIKTRLSKLLVSKKVLVVLDDLWEEQPNELDKLKRTLQVDGSMIHVIVTTRKEEIATKLSTSEEPYKLEPLKDDACWEIIKLTSMFDSKPYKQKLQEIGLNIAKKCGGVPLAARAIGFMLQSINDPFGWTKINNSDIWKESPQEKDVLPSLKLSYERMEPQLRACFSYCAIFPKGHSIVEDDLVHQWIALDFIERTKGKEYIKILLGMSFLQVSKLPSFSREDEVRYTMHDLVHDLATLTMADELIVFDDAPKTNAHARKRCRYSLLRKYNRTTKLSNVLPSKMRALRFSDSAELDIPSNAFSFAKCLRILDFSECSAILLPASIGRLKQMRCLIAPRMQNESLPKFITELSKLQYLNIDRSSEISALPESIGKLGCLNYLSLSGCSGISRLPDSFGDLKCMVRLDMSGCSKISELPDSLCCLTQLQYLDLSNQEDIDRLPEDIGNLLDLQYLNISWCYEIKELPESLTKLRNLLHLELQGCHVRGESLLGGLRGLTALQHLNMRCLDFEVIGHEVLDVLGNFTCLKYLNLRNSRIRAVDFIGNLTNLEHLDLAINFQLEFLPESIGNLKRLHTLDLSSCGGLKSLPDSIRELTGLKALSVEFCSAEVVDQASSLGYPLRTLPHFKVRADDVNRSCSNLPLLEGAHDASKLRITCLENARSLEEARKVKLLKKHNLWDLTLGWTVDAARLVEDKDLLGQLVPPRGLKIMRLRGYSSTSFPDWVMDISHHLTNLALIELSCLPKCTNLPPLGQLPNLGVIKLSHLPSIKIIGREFCGGKGAFPGMRRLFIEDMEGLEEWNTTYSVEDGVVFMFPVLIDLYIENCPRLRLTPCPPTFNECNIWSSDQVISSMEEVDKISHHSLPASRERELYLKTESDNCQSMRIFHHFSDLRDLRIEHPNLTSLPESMRQLTSLELLMLEGCLGMSALPEWLGELSSLTRLDITECKSIKCLPPCIQQLTKLQNIDIWYDQKELKAWCESEENKTKLAHVNIEFHRPLCTATERFFARKTNAFRCCNARGDRR